MPAGNCSFCSRDQRQAGSAAVGVKTAESSYGDAAWAKAVAGSKFKDMPLFGKAMSGHIALQDHDGDRVWFRNIKIRAL